jgi:hypothetical protein
MYLRLNGAVVITPDISVFYTLYRLDSISVLQLEDSLLICIVADPRRCKYCWR